MAAVSHEGPNLGVAEYVVPQNLDAEESVLGALMLSRHAIEAAADEVAPEDFYRRSHGTIFRAALTLHGRGEPVSAITLCAELEHRGDLEDIGGKIRIGELAELVPAASNVRHYARLVRDAARRRALLVDLQRISQQVIAGTWTSEEAADTLRTVAEQRGTTEAEAQIRVLSLVEFVEQPLAETEAIMGEGEDKVLVPKSLNILGGPGGVGKTTLGLHLVAHLCTGRDWLGIKVQHPIRVLLLENEGPHDLFAEKVKKFRERWDGDTLDDTMFVHDAPWGHFSWSDQRKAAELKAIARHYAIDMILANPLNRLGMKGAGTPEETNAFLDLLVRGGLGDDFGLFLIHHTRKPPPKSGGKRGQNGNGGSDLDELSGAWGPHPDLVMLLEHDGQRRVRLSLPKVRWGEQGSHGPFILYFQEDPGKPVGYTQRDTGETHRKDDGVLYDRIDAFLAKAPGPLGPTEVRSRVVGSGGRITALLERGAETGRYINSGTGARPLYSLPDPDEPELGE